MILKRLTLHNFGVYRNRHVVDLAPPSPKRPVILIGGLNGGGKTTFLDALQLALYGQKAQCSNRGDLGYEELLRRAVHRGVDPYEGASIEIELSHTARGKQEEILVRRGWTAREKHVRERLDVSVDGGLDEVLTEGWADRVEELIPARLSRFFFFDGEKIEALADLDRSADALRTAIHVLLGLDLVDQLVTDLQVIERRKRAERRSTAEREEVEAIDREVKALEARRAELLQECGRAKNALEQAEKELAKAEERFRLGGGHALAEQKSVEDALERVRQDIERAEEGLRDEAEGVVPLMLVMDLLGAIGDADEREQARAEARSLDKLLSMRDARTLAAAKSAGASGKVLKALVDLFDDDRRARQGFGGSGERTAMLALSTEGRATLAAVRASLTGELPVRIRRELERTDVLLEKQAALARKKESAPEEEAIATLAKARTEALSARAQAEAALRAAEAEHERVTREHEHKADKWKRLADKVADERLEERATERVISHAERVRGTMKRFRQAMLDKRVRRIEELVLEGFQRLLRKETLITGLSIDPKTFAMTLYGSDRRALSPERLSAGERQLLAVSIIGALAKASGRALPVVIDTPLGRLDSVHRDRLVDRYFPYASHQVILLSTDKEIDQAHYRRLEPYIGRSYVLRHDDKAGTSSVELGYFF